MKVPAMKSISAVLMLIFGLCAGLAQTSTDSLKSGFENPPEGARSRVWWHWMNGNITKVGIKLDLEWMKRVGLGGFQNFDAALATPLVVDHPLAYMTPEWKDAFKYATTLGDQLGLEEAIAGCPGWSESGGPWVPGAEGMKKYVWSETLVEGGIRIASRLPCSSTRWCPLRPTSNGISAIFPFSLIYARDQDPLVPRGQTERLAAMSPISRC